MKTPESTTPERLHSARPLRVGDQSAEIDLGIYDLVKEVWTAGFRTNLSCEDSFGLNWLDMNAADAVRFLDIAAGDDVEDDLHHRISWGGGSWNYSENHRKQGLWHYTFYVENLNHSEEYDPKTNQRLRGEVTGPTRFEGRVSLHFPPGDGERVIQRLRAYNAKSPAEAGLSKAPRVSRRD